ncbi:acyl-CoA dehydrogenase family protein [Hydrogenophaga laconesensis]|uniref:Alkylation response protein AidB-like acyl-CoA dehydrogenase n=1 Tax=Hydrogenophaga laconesensis TaxID=1805971 RepID=A0ABU1VAT5_9BURK|nr:acyl-CoA dehydrogenase family protein [Hydrogenophaga laconesensis]MDR7094591.1 alkylation response protein AidB-like acyl-CoA dehydrogenase [Hydrogenophaga laconesensis]
MDFDFADEQVELRQAVSRWLEREYGQQRRRRTMADGGWDSQAWRSFSELGLCGLPIGEAHGGMGMGAIEAMIVMEEFGRHAVPEPLGHAWLGAQLIQRCAPAHMASAWLPRIAAGEAWVALAHQERGHRHVIDRCTAKADRDGEGRFLISGQKDLIPAGDKAQALIVPAMLDGAQALFLVSLPQAAVRMEVYRTVDGRGAATATLRQAEAQCLSADVGALEWGIGLGIAHLCAEAVGLMEHAMALTIAHLNTRQQFGRPLAEFQVLRHRVADMKMEIELSRSMSYWASLGLEAEAPARRLALSQAKYQLSRSMKWVGQQAVQLHGAIGLTDEYGLSDYVRRLYQLEYTFGDGPHHLAILSEAQFADA